MTDFFSRLRVRRSVLKRTTRRKDLPEIVLYLEWLSGEMRRKVLDEKGGEHSLQDDIIQSNYKLVTGPEAEDLIAAHWKSQAAAPQQPIRKA